MSRLVERLSHFIGRVEVLALGAERERRRAEQALGEGAFERAREHARALLARVPASPVGLALLADAAEGCGLDDEALEALAALVGHVPWRREVWLRLGQTGIRTGWPHARAALERAARAPGQSVVGRAALLLLCDLDIEANLPARAMRWLDRIAPPDGDPDLDLALRRAEAFLALGDVEAAREHARVLAALERDDGRDRLVLAGIENRLPASERHHDPLELALAAKKLGAPQADRTLAQLVARLRASSSEKDRVALQQVRTALGEPGGTKQRVWQAAFALAEGQHEQARRALLRLLDEGDEQAARTLLGLAVESRDATTLRVLRERRPALVSEPLSLLLDAIQQHHEGRVPEALDRLERASSGAAGTWARELMQQFVAQWLPPQDAGRPSDWPRVLAELRRAAWMLDRGDLVPEIEQLAVERERPLRVALLGEFNAGKSTFLNALLGMDVTPTGVTPTTAALCWVAWAPDPHARIVVRGGPDRVVAHGKLKETLAAVHAAGKRVERVLLYAPIDRLERIELLDTPGFNAPREDDATTAQSGVEEAHLAIWLLDATAPLKNSERQVLSQIVSAGVPVQILINKADRVPADELGTVIRHVETSLEAIGIESCLPPIAFSARLALAGLLGDSPALEAAGWSRIEALLTETIVNRAARLRELALRRKASRIARELAKQVSIRARASEVHRTSRQEHRRALGMLAAKLDEQRRPTTARLLGVLNTARAALAVDLRPAELTSGEADSHKRRRFRMERAVERLAPPLASELRAILQSWDDRPHGVANLTDLDIVMRHAIRGAAAIYRGGPLLPEEQLREVADAAIAACGDHLLARAEEPAALAEPERVSGRVEALTLALRPSRH